VPAADIKVGTLMAQTGPLKEYGPPIKDGARFYNRVVP
jgi:ABC-type branched-subunit amino acid transport system substrate-binding protein